jgi:hypothetical protein
MLPLSGDRRSAVGKNAAAATDKSDTAVPYMAREGRRRGTRLKAVADVMANIANSSREQASGIEQVNRAVTAMDGHYRLS